MTAASQSARSRTAIHPLGAIAAIALLAGLAWALTGLLSARKSVAATEPPPRLTTFTELAGYPMDIDSAGALVGTIPAEIKSLDGKRVHVEGFVLPFDFVEGTDKVTTFALLRDQAACCYGAVPPPHAWVFVDLMDKNGSEYILDVPIAVEGELSVGELREEGEFHSIYRLKADRIVIPEEARGMAGQIQELQSNLIERSR